MYAATKIESIRCIRFRTGRTCPGPENLMSRIAVCLLLAVAALERAGDSRSKILAMFARSNAPAGFRAYVTGLLVTASAAVHPELRNLLDAIDAGAAPGSAEDAGTTLDPSDDQRRRHDPARREQMASTIPERRVLH